jgi:mono/diheme cytochrome c family protein
MRYRHRIGAIFAVAASAILGVAAVGGDVRAQSKDAPPAKAAPELEAPSPERGQAFAQKFCKECHLVDGGGAVTAQAGLPSLRGLANKPGQSGERIRNVLINPHPPMPDMQVSAQEILDIVAYMETLRTDKAAPPFLSPAQQGIKPKYPKPS